MLSMAYALPAGNAVRLVLSPPTGADELALLRRDDGAAPAGLNDAAAVPVYRGDPVRSVLDWLAVPAGVELRYRALWRVGSSWLDGGVRSVRADARFLDRSVEPLLVMRDRLDLGLRGYVERGELRPSSGEIPVLIASPLIEETPMPVVTVHLESEVQDVAPVGGLLAPDRGADSFTGHVSRVVMKAIGWSLNVDERLALRRAMTAVLAVNREVFEEAGMVDVEVQFSDMDDFMTYSAPVYQAVGTVSCVAVREIALPHTLVYAVSVPLP